MQFEQQITLAQQELNRCGIQSSSSHPISFHLLHWGGIKMPLPHYCSFKMNVAIFTAWYSLLFAAIFFIAELLSNSSIAVISAIITSLFAGITAGVSMATYYHYSAKRHALTPWQQLT
ncbi:hypothetical protein VT25_11450 [Photobacterium leiognathi subsp. mandapamensis]|nr:hypothetical protein VT25_11450 [Photobacterium leiognathi subsp. mandapamensis]PSV23706.1 hypothetical protein C0W44_02610 [Photobacterium leiognathi subsp. mandapamensis]